MKPTPQFDELTADQARNLTITERRERFQAYRARMQAADVDVSVNGTRWYVVDADLSPDQFDELPPARPGETRTPLVWIKFRDQSVGRVVVSRGRYDYDGGTWAARLSPVEDGDVIATVAALAWGRMVAGERPWDGPTVREHLGDPW
jgi:hypothetical protein